MKNRDYVKTLVACGLALAMMSSVLAQEVKQGTAKVVRIKGAARYSTSGNNWQQLKIGMALKAGTVIQTAADSTVDLVLGESEAGAGAPGGGPVTSQLAYSQPGVNQNVVRMSQDTVLAVDKLTSTETGADVVTDTQLDLRAGVIYGSVKKLSAGSEYSVKIPNGVAGIRGTVYTISADGVVTVISGTVVVAYTKPDGTTVTQEVNAGYEYDLRTGQLTPIPAPRGQTISQAVREASVGPTTQQTVVPIDHTIYYVSPIKGGNGQVNNGGD